MSTKSKSTPSKKAPAKAAVDSGPPPIDGDEELEKMTDTEAKDLALAHGIGYVDRGHAIAALKVRRDSVLPG